ncbi:MAG: transcription elongation factor GreA [Armatimonadota bacterium]|nr:transcription elongation factor GreA [Armatimonadota bacterium]
MPNRNIKPNRTPKTPLPEGEKEIILTESGLHKLAEELEYLKGTRRKEIAERIRAAKEFGDLFENAEYDDAKNEQAFVEGRILQLEQILRNARVADNNATDPEAVTIGSTVRVKDVTGGDEITYTIVGSAEADPLRDRISNESPVGQALIGRKRGETVTVRVPAGTLQYTILDVAHQS